jgi:hypothetical protein
VIERFPVWRNHTIMQMDYLDYLLHGAADIYRQSSSQRELLGLINSDIVYSLLIDLPFNETKQMVNIYKPRLL